MNPARIPEWQTGRPVIGDIQGAPGAKIVELAILSTREARKELATLKALGERDASQGMAPGHR